MSRAHGAMIRLSLLVLGLGATTLLLSGCTLLYAQTSSGQPNVSINSPDPNSQVVVGQAVSVMITATDPSGAGLARVDLLVDDVRVDSYEVMNNESRVEVVLKFTPKDVGVVSIVARAYQVKGIEGDSAHLPLNVVAGN